METALFWIIWGCISFWALKTFYFSFSREKLDRLRKASLGFNLAVLILMFLPWLPSIKGGNTGFELVLSGNAYAILFALLQVTATLLFLTKETVLLKFASMATIINTVVLFMLMYQLRPGTFTLTLFDIAPIIAILFLLIGDVAVLLMWQQLELKNKYKTLKKRK